MGLELKMLFTVAVSFVTLGVLAVNPRVPQFRSERAWTAFGKESVGAGFFREDRTHRRWVKPAMLIWNGLAIALLWLLL